MSLADAISNDSEVQVLAFRLGREEYGVEVSRVQEIERREEATRLPQMPHFVEGIINWRNRTVPVVDLHGKLGVRGDARSEYMVVVDVDGLYVALLVDTVPEVLSLSNEIIDPPPQTSVGDASEYISGVGKLENRLVILLQVENLFSSREREAMQAA
jgi:purine-binding chemotaxis protein CheW